MEPDGKRCLGCGEWLPLTAFYPQARGIHGRKARCAWCLGGNRTCSDCGGRLSAGSAQRCLPCSINARRAPIAAENTAVRCACGCGELTPVATKTSARFGHVQGQPMRYCRGHKAKRDGRPIYRDDGTALIPLTRGRFAIVDAADAELVGSFRWIAQPHHGNWYARRSRSDANGPREPQMHRFVIDAPAGSLVDHVNGDGLDNRRENLRLATPCQNVWNRKRVRPGAAPYRGVYRNGSGWIARIGVSGKRITLGTFADPAGAARAYDEAARRFHGEFARTNFP